MIGKVTEMPLRAANLGRVSKDKSGNVRSVAEQHDDNRLASEANGWMIVGEYADEGSASRFARKEREDWTRLVADVEAGHLDAVIMWEPSRGSRKLGEWVDFLDLCREHRVIIHVTTHRHSYDMSVPRDWRALAEDGFDSAWESEKTSERVKRSLAANARAGKSHGICKWGYERIYHPKTKDLLEQKPVPAQAKVIAGIIRDVASGKPVSAVRDDLEARGVPAPMGAAWHRRQVSRIATSVAYIGKIKVDGELIDAGWPPIVDDEGFEDMFWAAQHLLTSPERKTTKPGKAKHLLSYIMTCGECGADLYADMPRKRMITAKYMCSNARQHCTSIPMADADEYVTSKVREKLSRPDLYKHLVAGNDERVVQARAEAARLRAELDEWAAADISAHAYAIRESKLMPLIESAERRSVELSVPLALRELVAPGADIAARWEAMPVAARRDVIRLLLPVLVLLPGSGPARDRIRTVRPEKVDEPADLVRAERGVEPLVHSA